MELAYLTDWLNLLGRWAHLVFGIAWIGSSFYFVWLDDSLEKPGPGDATTLGDLWSVHGGGFYHSVKFRSAPNPMPRHLHWFYWESYSTWLSGFFLMCVLYYSHAQTYLIDKHVADLTQWQAIAIGLGFLAGGWIVYDRMCKLLREDGAVAIGVLCYCVVAAWALTQLFSGRGAFIHFGAMLATIMSANVFFVIIPNQRKIVAAMTSGQPIDPAWGAAGKQRSVHNTYFTLPVLFCMISNHYAMTYSSSQAWLVLLAMSVAGALIRLFFVLKHKSPPKWWILALGLVLLAVVAWSLQPAPRPAVAAGAPGAAPTGPVSFADVSRIVHERCSGCHSEHPTIAGFASAPKGIMFDSDDRIEAQAELIHQQAVVTRVMPIGNLTNMTEAERAQIDRWFQDGAKR